MDLQELSATLTLVVPIASLVLMLITVLGLYVWWSSGSPEAQQTNTGAGYPTTPVEDLDSIFSGISGSSSVSAASADDPFGTLRSQEQTFLAASGSSPLPSSGGIPAAVGDAVEVMRVFRDLSDGTLFVWIDGRTYRSLNDFTEASIGRRFFGNVKALAQFARLGEINIPDPTPADLIPPPPPVQPAASSWQATPQAPAPPPPSGGLLGSRRGGNKNSEEIPEEAPPIRSMQEEIEELLQQRIYASPYAGRSIHVRSSIDGGVLIEVDGQYYEGLGEVPQEDIKAFIRSVIQEWEGLQ